MKYGEAACPSGQAAIFCAPPAIKRKTTVFTVVFGALAGTRIPDPLIKSQMLCQLSYERKKACGKSRLSIIPQALG